MRTNYTQMPTLIENRETFTGSSVTARYDISLITSKGVYHPYVITSYTTTIALIIEDFCLLNTTKYSRTTSRIQNIIKQLYPNAEEITDVEKGRTSEDAMLKILMSLLEEE